MFRQFPKMREAPSGVTNVSPHHYKSHTPDKIFTTLLQGMYFQTVGVTPYRWLTWSACRTGRTEIRTTKASTGSSTTRGRPFSEVYPRQAKIFQAMEYRPCKIQSLSSTSKTKISFKVLPKIVSQSHKNNPWSSLPKYHAFTAYSTYNTDFYLVRMHICLFLSVPFSPVYPSVNLHIFGLCLSVRMPLSPVR